MLNRNIAPEIAPLKDINFGKAQEFITPKGNKIYYLHQEGQEGLRIDLLFPSGASSESADGVAKASLSQLFSGTSTKDAAGIATAFDFYGSYFDRNMGSDRSSISFYLLNKYRDQVFEILRSCLEDAQYPESELDIYKRNAVQKLKVEEQKNGFLARRAFFSRLFGPDHVYGKYVSEADIIALNSKETSSFYRAHFQGKRPQLLLAGGIDSSFLQNLGNWVDQLEEAKPFQVSDKLPSSYGERLNLVEKPGSLQASVFVGRTLFNRHHEDYPAVSVLNMILGGYFGSRLMSNIREEKGYTYGIYSRILPLQQGGCFYIASDVRNENWKDVLVEIDKELQRLCDEPVSEEELQTVKQFLLGNLLRTTDGPFAIADNIKTLVENNLDADYYKRFNKVINDISAEELQLLAQRYLAPAHLIQTVVGTT